jgi:hypothetical protein
MELSSYLQGLVTGYKGRSGSCWNWTPRVEQGTTLHGRAYARVGI